MLWILCFGETCSSTSYMEIATWTPNCASEISRGKAMRSKLESLRSWKMFSTIDTTTKMINLESCNWIFMSYNKFENISKYKAHVVARRPTSRHWLWRNIFPCNGCKHGKVDSSWSLLMFKWKWSKTIY